MTVRACPSWTVALLIPSQKPRRPVSRVLFPLAGSAVIPLRRALLHAWCDTPGARAEDGPCAPPIRSCSWRGLPCGPRRRSPGGLLPHPFTLTPKQVRGGLLSVALSLGSRRVDVIHRHVSVEPGLSSIPDQVGDSDCPAVWRTRYRSNVSKPPAPSRDDPHWRKAASMLR